VYAQRRRLAIMMGKILYTGINELHTNRANQQGKAGRGAVIILLVTAVGSLINGQLAVQHQRGLHTEKNKSIAMIKKKPTKSWMSLQAKGFRQLS
jgi:hypothetical protein